MLNYLLAVLLGVLEGVTEWLPISSTGHLILAGEFLRMEASDAFLEMFDVVIQFGAILAVVVIFWNRLWPFCVNPKGKGFVGRYCRRDVWEMWFHVLAAILPSALIGLPLDDWMTEHLHNPLVVSAMLILYGVFFLLMERTVGRQRPAVRRIGKSITAWRCSSACSSCWRWCPARAVRARRSSARCCWAVREQSRRNLRFIWPCPQWPGPALSSC